MTFSPSSSQQQALQSTATFALPPAASMHMLTFSFHQAQKHTSHDNSSEDLSVAANDFITSVETKKLLGGLFPYCAVEVQEDAVVLAVYAEDATTARCATELSTALSRRLTRLVAGGNIKQRANVSVRVDAAPELNYMIPECLRNRIVHHMCNRDPCAVALGHDSSALYFPSFLPDNNGVSCSSSVSGTEQLLWGVGMSLIITDGRASNLHGLRTDIAGTTTLVAVEITPVLIRFHCLNVEEHLLSAHHATSSSHHTQRYNTGEYLDLHNTPNCSASEQNCAAVPFFEPVIAVGISKYNVPLVDFGIPTIRTWLGTNGGSAPNAVDNERSRVQLDRLRHFLPFQTHGVVPHSPADVPGWCVIQRPHTPEGSIGSEPEDTEGTFHHHSSEDADFSTSSDRLLARYCLPLSMLVRRHTRRIGEEIPPCHRKGAQQVVAHFAELLCDVAVCSLHHTDDKARSTLFEPITPTEYDILLHGTAADSISGEPDGALFTSALRMTGAQQSSSCCAAPRVRADLDNGFKRRKWQDDDGVKEARELGAQLTATSQQHESQRQLPLWNTTSVRSQHQENDEPKAAADDHLPPTEEVTAAAAAAVATQEAVKPTQKPKQQRKPKQPRVVSDADAGAVGAPDKLKKEPKRRRKNDEPKPEAHTAIG